MLILARRLGNTYLPELSTGEAIKVTVVEINGNQVRLEHVSPGRGANRQVRAVS